MSSEQAPWVKVGVPVRRKASGFLHSRGEIVEVDGGLGVRCPTIQTVKRDDDIASSWEECDSNVVNPKIGQAEWIKEGTDVRFLGGGQPGTIVKVPGGLAVRYGGDRALLWSGSIAESWAPCEGASLPLAAEPVTLAGGPCAKPSPVDGVKTLDALLEQALCFRVGWPDSATTRHALRQLWERLDAEIGDDVRRLPDLAAKVREADAEAASTKLSNLSHTHDGPLPPSTMEQVLARLDAIDAALKPLVHTPTSSNAKGRAVDMSREVTPHIARTRIAATAGLAVPEEIPCPTCGIVRWGRCRAVEGLDNLPTGEASQPSTTPTEPTSPAKRYVPAHIARDEAASSSGWKDSYMAPCSHCGAARWEGCTAVGDEPDYGEPVPRVNVRLWNAEGTGPLHVDPVAAEG